jgi:hypothetical protein|tara:strand:+ start:842 stop:1132 length:291 start_codon:yes stop_codon:yes gene_type:complete
MNGKNEQKLREYYDYTRGSWDDDPGEAFSKLSPKEKYDLKTEMLQEKQAKLDHAEETNDPMNITPSYNQKHKAKMLGAFPQAPVGKLIQREFMKRK